MVHADVPRMLRDMSRRDLSVDLFGTTLPAPLVLVPIGVLEMAHSEADLAVARAATAEGVPFLFSSPASVTMEDYAEVMVAVRPGAPLGRPYVYGLAVAGEEGVREVIRNTIADFDLTLGLAGCASVAEVTAERLAPGA